MTAVTLDVLAFAAHPDDIEITCGGTLIKLVERGRKVGACDLTGGEMGTYGSAALREQECAEATRRMGLKARFNCKLPDSGLFNTREQQAAVVDVIRRAKPEIVIAPGHDQRHPDHAVCARLVFDACYFAGLAKFGSGATHRPRKILFVHTSHSPMPPGFVVDISAQMEKKLHAVAAYASQFPAEEGKKGLARQEELFGRMRDRARGYGMMIDRHYGEGFYQRETMEVDDVFTLPGRSI